MQKSDINQSQPTHRRVQVSTTLNRKYVARPVSDIMVKRPVQLRPTQQLVAQPPVQRQSVAHQPVARSAQPVMRSAQPVMRSAQLTSQTTAAQTPQLSARELKDQAIKKALASTIQTSKKEAKKTKKKSKKMRFSAGRFVLAMLCAATAVFSIVYFVNLNTPDLSLRVAALQTGIEAKYPTYVPRDFSLSDITSESGKITLNFKNSSTDDAFTLIEEDSSWDTNALLNNYVKDEYGNDYTTIREQGLTIYINNSDACWVNGGVVYKIKVTSGSLTKKQIKSIAVSL